MQQSEEPNSKLATARLWQLSALSCLGFFVVAVTLKNSTYSTSQLLPATDVHSTVRRQSILDEATEVLRKTKEEEKVPTSCSQCTVSKPRCRDIYENHTYSELEQSCEVNPSQARCSLTCHDWPQSYNAHHQRDPQPFRTPTTAASIETLFWPPINAQRWIEDPYYCQEKMNTTQSCFLDKYRWGNQNAQATTTTFDAPTACQLLHRANVSRVHILGDSFGRHLWQGFNLVLTGDYNLHSSNKQRKVQCRGDYAFAEKECMVSSPEMKVCRGMVTTTYENAKSRKRPLVVIDEEEEVTNLGRTLYLYMVGNHPAQASNRSTIYNAKAYEQHHWRHLFGSGWRGASHDEANRNNSTTANRNNDYLMWIPPHYKISVNRMDETNQKSYQFLQDSFQFFAHWNVPTLNTYSLTEAASSFFCSQTITDQRQWSKYINVETCQETAATYDGYHFARDINLWKTHLLLEQFRRHFGLMR